MCIRTITILIFISSIITACNLGAEAPSTIPQPDTISLDTPVADEIASDTPTTIALATDTGNQQDSEQFIVPANGEPSNETDVAIALASDTIEAEHFVIPGCNLQHPDWNTYTVRVGDTLTAIATRFNTSIQILAQINCLADANLIYVGQVLRVPSVVESPPLPTLPQIDMGPPAGNVCVVVPVVDTAPIYQMGVTGRAIATLVGTVRFIRRADNAYIVDVPGHIGTLWVSATETQLLGRSCPDNVVPTSTPPLPVIGGDGEPPANSCSVERNIGINDVSVFRDPGNGLVPVARLGTYLPFVAETEFGYEVELPGCCNETGYVWTADAHLAGRTCPGSDPVEPPMTIPAYGNDGAPPENSCSFIRNPGIESVFIYLTPGDTFSMIGTLSNWLPFQQAIDEGYIVTLPDGNSGWIPEDDVALVGTNCSIR